MWDKVAQRLGLSPDQVPELKEFACKYDLIKKDGTPNRVYEIQRYFENGELSETGMAFLRGLLVGSGKTFKGD